MTADPRRQFGPAAEKYLQSPSHANEAELAYCVEVAQPGGGAVLDVATGAGHTALAFAERAEWVLALDITLSMLAITRREASRRSLANIRVALGFAEAIPTVSARFEGVTCRTAAHHFHDVPAFLREANRVTRPGGWLLLVDTLGIVDPDADEELDRIEFLRDPSHVRNLTEDVWRSRVAEAGYRVEHVEAVPRPHNAYGWLDRMSVDTPTRERIEAAIVGSEGWLRDYLRPHGEGETLTFHLRQILLRAVRS